MSGPSEDESPQLPTTFGSVSRDLEEFDPFLNFTWPAPSETSDLSVAGEVNASRANIFQIDVSAELADHL